MTLLETNSFLAFARLSPLLGSRVPYYRLLLPDLVNEERLLYLDSDLQVNVDVSPLFEVDMGTKSVGFVVSGMVKTSLDHRLLTSIGRPPDASTFNSGVCLFNTSEWHRQKCWERLLSFAGEHETELKTADQSLLNALFADDC
jgi:lipopolysaccharide biosynthesis glycosyltransferase